MEWIELGTTPIEEECAQLGDDNYTEDATLQGRVFRRMLLRVFPPPASIDATYAVRALPHDFGRYYEVCLAARPLASGDLGAALAYEARVVDELPLTWDAIARYELLACHPILPVSPAP